MLVTLFFFTMYMICQFGGVAHGTGQRRSALTDANAQVALEYWFFCEIFYTLATTALKISIGLFLLRITVDRTHVWIIRGIMYSCVVVAITWCFIVVFQCHPVSFWWTLDPNIQGSCLSPSLVVDALYVISALNSIADWVFGILPIFIVRNLQMKTSVKVIVASILGFAAMYVVPLIPGCLVYILTRETVEAQRPSSACPISGPSRDSRESFSIAHPTLPSGRQ